MHADGNVKAYIYLALSEKNDVTVMTSEAIRGTVHPLMHQWASSHLRNAHEFSGFVQEPEENEDTSMFVDASVPLDPAH